MPRESVLKRFIDTPEWTAEMVTRNGISHFMGAAAMKKYMEEEYADLKVFLTELELAKK